jgi:hypothetical protein
MAISNLAIHKDKGQPNIMIDLYRKFRILFFYLKLAISCTLVKQLKQ